MNSKLSAIDRSTAAHPSKHALNLKIRLTVPGTDCVFPGTMEHFIDGEASILMTHNFQKGTIVRVEFHGFHFEAAVLFCERKGDLFDTHVAIADSDEAGCRRDPRYVVNLPACVFASWLKTPLPVTLVDISRRGVGLESACELEVGASIAVESGSNFAFGTVRHCRKLASGTFRSGIHIYDAFLKETQNPPHEKPSRMRSLFSRAPVLKHA